LSNFETGKGTTIFAIRILADGGVLAADTTNVLRFDSSGNVIKTYSIPGATTLFALNLDPDGVTAWTGDLSTGEVTRFNIATGAIVTQWNAGPLTSLGGLTVFGEITQGGGGGGQVPEPSSLVLLGTGAAILAFASHKKLGRRLS
jgi:PEP-CTERM motif